jgi:hypothetical protein
MSRFLHQAVSLLTMIGYLLVITWGPVWHDHRHCHAPACCEGLDCVAPEAVEHSHPHCCSHHHHHANCGQESPEQTAAVSESSPSPCQTPLHDEDCPVCRILAHPPLAAPQVAVVDASAPVPGFVFPSAPLAERPVPAVYDSRGPPLV